MTREEHNKINDVWTRFRKMYPNVTVSQKKLTEFLKKDDVTSLNSDFIAQLFYDSLS